MLSYYRNSEISNPVKDGAKRFLRSKAANVIATVGIASTVFDIHRAYDAYSQFDVRDSAVRSFFAGTEAIAVAGYAWTLKEYRKGKSEELPVPDFSIDMTVDQPLPLLP